MFSPWLDLQKATLSPPFQREDFARLVGIGDFEAETLDNLARFLHLVGVRLGKLAETDAYFCCISNITTIIRERLSSWGQWEGKMGALNLQAPLEIGFCVADLKKSLAFWCDGMGLTFISDISTSERAATECGFGQFSYHVIRLQLPTGERIKLFAPNAKVPLGPVRQRPLEQTGFAFTTLIVKDLTDTLAMLARSGFSPRAQPYELRSGTFVALVDDPDGNIVELVQYADIASYREVTVSL